MATQDRVLILEDGPWSEMIDALAPTARKEGAYQLGQNVYPSSPDLGGGLVGRPGTWQLGDRLLTTPATFIQGIVQFSHDIVEATVAVANGEIYTLDWLSQTWTKVVSTADQIAAGASISAGNIKVSFLVVNSKLLISNAGGPPVLWDGSAGAGGLTSLTACPPLYGVPTLHEGRVFGIKRDDTRTMVWSEADDPTTGYEAGGFNNAWTVRQTNPNPLTRLVGTNNGLVIFRERSVTIAVGDVGPNFQSTNTHDAIDESIGTKTPFAVLEVGSNILFLDADCHLHMIRPGGLGTTPLWSGLKQTLRGGTKRAGPFSCIAVEYTPASLALFAIENSIADNHISTILAYDVSREVPVPVGVWTPGGATGMNDSWINAMAMVTDTSGGVFNTVPRLLHADVGYYGGYIYAHGNPDDAVFVTDDTSAVGTQAIEHIVRCQPLGYSTKREKVFDRIDIAARAFSPETLEVSATTARGVTADPQTITVGPAGGGWDFGAWDAMDWDAEIDFEIEEHGDVGIDLQSRWIRPQVRHETIGEQFGLVAISVTAYATDDDPAIP